MNSAALKARGTWTCSGRRTGTSPTSPSFPRTSRRVGALLPDQTLLVVEVTSESNAETNRGVKRRRYAEYRAPLYLLVDRIEGSVTLFSEPGHLGYTRVDGPHPFGAVLRLPDPFNLDLDTSGLTPA